MKEITVISGKGGTGKTTITASLTQLMKPMVADCDVDAPNLKYILNPTENNESEFKGTYIAEKINGCNNCGKCLEYCRFDAISEDFEIIRDRCEGCGVCVYICPQDALKLKNRVTGKIYESMTRFGDLIHAELGIGEEASGKLVSKVKELAREKAKEKGNEYLLIDGSPGTGCPVIASIGGVDLALVVTEPTETGIHDFKRVLKVIDHFNIEPAVCINKYDLNKEKTKEIIDFCKQNQIDVLAKLPYSQEVTKAMLETKTIIEYSDSKIAREIRELAKKLKAKLEETNEGN